MKKSCNNNKKRAAKQALGFLTPDLFNRDNREACND